MAPCTPLSDSVFHPPPSPPGFGGLAIQLPDLNIPFPDLPLNDLLALFDSLGMILPPGLMKPNLEPDFLNDIYGAINDLLSKFTPFLMLYKFFLPILALILCIIEVLCSIANPFKLMRAIRRLFRVCIPDFLALFPFFALILMIIALILLIIALIEYLINRLLQLIKIIIHNILILAKASQRLDNDSIIAIVKKIGDLLCLLQNLFVILGVILIIFQIIKAILSLSFNIPPCDDGNTSGDGCCTPDVCPSFIKNNPTITSSTGNFLYYNEVGLSSGLTLPPGFPLIIFPARQESWQFYDPALPFNQAFINITAPFDLPGPLSKTFFPAGTSYNATTPPLSTPYNISFRLFYNPTIFGASDPKGPRFIRVSNAIVQSPPTDGVSSFDGHTFIAPFNGTLNLIGGVVQEDDGTPILDSNGKTIPLNTFFHLPVNANGEMPLPSDGVLFSNITYTFTINYEVLVGAALITLGCVPSVAIDKNFINTTIGLQFNSNGAKLATITLPDIAATQQCVTNAITTYRQSISLESTNTFQTNILFCLSQLRTGAITALQQAVAAGFDQYKSTFTIDPAIQFTTLPIAVNVELKESSGQLMTTNLPADSTSAIAAQITGDITLGQLSNFTYDGYQFFTANITSTIPGNGLIKIAFDNNFISTLTNPASIDQAPSVAITELAYTFVESTKVTPDTGEPRRDEGDVSREGGN